MRRGVAFTVGLVAAGAVTVAAPPSVWGQEAVVIEAPAAAPTAPAELLAGLRDVRARLGSGGAAERAGTAPAPGGAEGLRGVFHDDQLALLRDLRERVHVGALPVEVDGQDGLEPGGEIAGEPVLEALGREVQGLGVDVDEDSASAGADDGADGGEEAEGRGEDFVAGADAAGGEREPDGVGAGGAADAGGRAGELRGALLEGFQLRAEDELLGFADAVDGGANFVADAGVLPGQVQQRDRARRHAGGARLG